MARVSNFFENFEYTRPDSILNMYDNTITTTADAHPAQTTPQKPCPTQTKTAGKSNTMKSLMMKPFHGLCAVATSYKQHLTTMVNTNLNTTETKVPEHDNVEAGSTAYGLRPASDEELRRQSEKNHIDYVFGLGPDACTINNSATKTTVAYTTSTSTSTAKNTAVVADLKPQTLDVRTCWNQAYLSDTSSEIENINNACDELDFWSIGYNPVLTPILEDA